MRVLLFASLLAGCSGSGSDVDLTAPCGPDQRTAAEVLDWIQSPYEVTLDYHAGPSTTMMISARYTGGAIVCHEPVPEVREYSYVDVDVDVQVLTTDGAFDEYVTVPARTTAFPWSEFQIAIRADELRGTFDPGNPDLHDRVVVFAAQFQEGDLWGSVNVNGIQANGVGVSVPMAQWRIGDPQP